MHLSVSNYRMKFIVLMFRKLLLLLALALCASSSTQGAPVIKKPNVIIIFSDDMGSVVRKEPMFWEFGRGTAQNGDQPKKGSSPNLAVRDGKWKLLVNGDGSAAELYNLDIDHKETTNLAVSEKRHKKRLTTAALKWKDSLPAN